MFLNKIKLHCCHKVMPDGFNAPILRVLYAYIEKIHKDRRCVISLKYLIYLLILCRHSGICWFISLQQHLPLSVHKLSLGTAPDPTLWTWGVWLEADADSVGEKEKTDRSVHYFLSDLRCRCVWGMFSTLSSSLLHPAKMDSWKTRIKLCYTIVWLSSQMPFFASKFLPSVGPYLSLSLRVLFVQTLNQIQR